MTVPSKELIPRIEAAGYCCLFSFLRANYTIQTHILANHLHVHRRTIALWRRVFREQKLVSCPKCKSFHFDLNIFER